jgi:hypothetical protein
MRYIDFKRKFNDYPIITYQEIKNSFGLANHSQLYGWQKQGLLIKLKRACFLLSDQQADVHLVANMLNHSYISTEYALAYYQIIPDIAQTITNVSRDRNEKISNSLGNFHYRKISGELFTGYTLVKSMAYPDYAFRIATPEKALFDLVYLRSDLKTEKDFESLRLHLPKNFRIAELKKYRTAVNAPQIIVRIENLIKYLYASAQ